MKTQAEIDPTLPLEVQSVDVRKVTDGATELAERYETYQVATDEEYAAGADDLKGIKDAQKLVESERKKITQPMDEAKRNVMDFFRPFSDRLSIAESRIKTGLITYKRKRDAEAAEAQRIANDKAEKERQRLAKLAEKAEERGDSAKAETFQARAENTQPAPIAESAPKVSGISTKKVWKFRVTDKAKIPDKYKVVDEKMLGGIVRAMKDSCDIPGIEVFEEESMSARGR